MSFNERIWHLWEEWALQHEHEPESYDTFEAGYWAGRKDVVAVVPPAKGSQGAKV